MPAYQAGLHSSCSGLGQGTGVAPGNSFMTANQGGPQPFCPIFGQNTISAQVIPSTGNSFMTVNQGGQQLPCPMSGQNTVTTQVNPNIVNPSLTVNQGSQQPYPAFEQNTAAAWSIPNCGNFFMTVNPGGPQLAYPVPGPQSGVAIPVNTNYGNSSEVKLPCPIPCSNPGLNTFGQVNFMGDVSSDVKPLVNTRVIPGNVQVTTSSFVVNNTGFSAVPSYFLPGQRNVSFNTGEVLQSSTNVGVLQGSTLGHSAIYSQSVVTTKPMGGGMSGTFPNVPQQLCTTSVHVTPTCTVSTSSNFTKPFVMPEVYSGQSNFDDWLAHFNLCKTINQWQDSQACAFMAVKLKGTALQTYNDLGKDEQTNLNRLIEALRARFDPQRDSGIYRAQLRARTRYRGESLPELAGSIRRLTGKAYCNHSVQVKEDIAKDHFVDALDDREMQKQIRRLKPKDLHEALRIAIEEESLGKLEKQSGRINTVVEEDDVVGLQKKISALQSSVSRLQRTGSNRSQQKYKRDSQQLPFQNQNIVGQGMGLDNPNNWGNQNPGFWNAGGTLNVNSAPDQEALDQINKYGYNNVVDGKYVNNNPPLNF